MPFALLTRAATSAAGGLPALLLAAALTLAAGAAPAQVSTAPGPTARTDNTRVELLADAPTLVAGQAAWVGVKLTHADHWHSYWKNPGDSGAPTTLTWALPPGFTAGEVQWPYPKRIPVAHLANYGYEGTVVLPVQVQVPADAPAGRATLQVEVNWLECADVCIPANATVALTLPVAGPDGATSSAPGEVARAMQATQPTPLPLPATALSATASETHLLLTLKGADWRGAEFFPHTPGLLLPAYVQPYRVADGGAQLQVRRAEGQAGPWPDGPLDGVLVVRAADGTTRAHTLTVAVQRGTPALLPEAPAVGAEPVVAPAGADLGMWAALLLAFGGGLLLNLMPCVFPVLAIKTLAVIGQSPAQRRSHALGYAAGVLLSMLALAGLLLALRAAGEGLGWGFQLQSPAFVAAMAALFFLLGLNLAGVFAVGGAVQRGAGDLAMRLGAHDTAPAWRRHAAALADGALAVAIATPCTAPFMGAALGFALQAPPAATLGVFAALAAGLAAPVVVLTTWPALAARLPRPGAWMDTLKTLFAFPLFGTVVWLVWVFGQQTGMDAVARLLGGLVLLGLAAWLWGRTGGLLPRAAGGAVAAALALALALPGLATPEADSPAATAAAEGDWQPWSPGEVAALQAQGRPVFVDYTAAWCITCQVNKKTVLNTARVQAAFRDRGVALMRADWTRRDPEITRSLQALGRSGVPVYVLYGSDGRPRVLSELLTAGAVLQALDEAVPAAAAQSPAAAPAS